MFIPPLTLSIFTKTIDGLLPALPTQGNITVTLPPKMETRFKTGDMVAVGNTVVVAQRRGSHLVLCCVDTADVIGSIDVTDLCSIYGEFHPLWV